MGLRSRSLLAWPVVLLFSTGLAAGADLFHLKNGATITADAWEEEGDSVVIHQGSGRLVIPKTDILRVDRGAGAPSLPPAASRPGPPVAKDRTPSVDLPLSVSGDRPIPDEEIDKQLDLIRRRIRDYPMGRTENIRQLTSLLCRLGAAAYKRRDYDAALARFREVLENDPHHPQGLLGIAATYFSQGQDVYARSTLEQALLDHPDEPAVLALLGDVYNSEERPEDALAAWQKSFALKPDPGLKARIEKLQREHAIEGSYRRSEAAHFTLKYDGDRVNGDLESQILETLESRYSDLVTRFDYLPRQAIVVIVYPQQKFYEATLAESNVGGLFDGKIRMPVGGLTRLDDESRRVLIHELAHAFISGRSGNMAPRWLQEGLAQQIEGRRIGPSLGIPLAKEYRALENKESWGTNFSYPSALSFVEFLIDREGFPSLVDALGAMAGGADSDAAFFQVMRETLQELRQAWGESIVSRYLQ